MNLAKNLVALTFIFWSVSTVFAQIDTHKVVWKNLKVEYKSFYDIEATVINTNNQPIYFNCLYPASEFQYEGLRLLRKVGSDDYLWNIWRDGVETKDSIKKAKEEADKLAKLKKSGKYVPEGCKLNPNEEFTFRFDNTTWDSITAGDTIMFEPYKSGKFRFQLSFATVESDAISESPEFLVASEK